MDDNFKAGDFVGTEFLHVPQSFRAKEGPLKMCFLSEPQSLFNENIDLSTAAVLVDNVAYEPVDNNELNAIEIQITKPAGVDLDEVKSIVLYQEGKDGRYAYIVKNVTKLSDKMKSWWIYPVFCD